MPLTFNNARLRQVGLLSTTTTIAAIGLAYLCWRLYNRRSQPSNSAQTRPELKREASADEWENATDTPTREYLPTPQQLYKYGLEHLNISIDYWQRALDMIEISLANQTDDRTNEASLIELKQKVQFLLSKIDVSANANELASILRQEQAAAAATVASQLSTSSSTKTMDGVLSTVNRQESIRVEQELQTVLNVQNDLNTFNDRRSLRSIRSTDSFQSAPDEAEWLDASDLIFDPSSPYYSLPSFYVYGLRLAEKNQVPYRKLRTKLLRCSSNTDYLAKLYCVRSACDEILSSDDKKEYLKQVSRAICERFLERASKVSGTSTSRNADRSRFIQAFEQMNNLLADENSWSMINDELASAGIKNPSVYNVGIDFMLLEGFELLDAPPSAIRTILQNRWLSEAFREQALNKAVSYALKVRRATAKHHDGFLATFITLIEDITPVFAWGILGPDNAVKPMCLFLKESVLDFARSLYDLKRTDYSSLTSLSSDIDRQMNDLIRTIATEFNVDPSLVVFTPSPTTVRFS